MTGHQFRIKRLYKPPDDEDGVRVLVDRLWPRGLSRERARIDRPGAGGSSSTSMSRCPSTSTPASPISAPNP